MLGCPCMLKNAEFKHATESALSNPKPCQPRKLNFQILSCHWIPVGKLVLKGCDLSFHVLCSNEKA